MMDSAALDTLWNYFPGQTEEWWPSTVSLVQGSPGSGMCQCPAASSVGRLPQVPAGDDGTIPHSMHGKMDACCHGGEFDKVGKPWTERALFNINRWAMVFPSDYLLV